MSTVTASLLNANVKAVHTGVVAVGAAYETVATLTAASVILLNEVPQGATLVDWWAFIENGAEGQFFEFGTSNTPSGIAAVFSLSASGAQSPGDGYRCPSGNLMPVRISLSDDVQPAQVRTWATIGADISNSLNFTWTLFYTMDGLVGRTKIR